MQMANSNFTTEELNNEIWLPVVGYEGVYSVSNLGRVVRHALPSQKRGDYLPKQKFNNCGYLRVWLYSPADKSQVPRFVHRLVAMAFLGEPPNEKSQVNHRDGDKANNRLTNLEWNSPSENTWHAVHVTGKIPKGSKSFFAKLHESDVVQIKSLLMTGKTCVAIARLYNLTATTIQYIKQGKTWGHVHVEGFYPSTNR